MSSWITSAPAAARRVLRWTPAGPELAVALAVSPTRLANHLRRLRERGLVAVRRSGRLGVALFDALVEQGALVRHDRGARLGEGGPMLARFGIEAPEPSRRLMAYACLDSSEGRPHLGGALGAEPARALGERGWVEPQPGSRGARITPSGRRALRRLLPAGSA